MKDLGGRFEVCVASWPLLAESEPSSQLADGVRNDRGWINPQFHGWLLPLSIAVCAGFVVWLVVRRANLLRRWWRNHPSHLFGQLCRAHRLDWSQRRLLRRLANSHGLDHAVRLFLEPDRFQSAAAKLELDPFRSQIDRLQRKLFREHSN